MRYGSRKWEEENSATRRRHRWKGRKRQKTPSPHTMCHTPHWASAGRVAFYYFLFLKRRKCIRGHFLVGFWHPQWSFARLLPHPQGHPQASAGIRACVGRYVNQNGWFSGPCLATLLPRLIEIARACNHSS